MRRNCTILAVLLLPAVAAACGGGNSSPSASAAANGKGCVAASGRSGNGAHLSIGSKAFAEEELLAAMTKEVLEKHDFTVAFTFQAKDPAIGRALKSGTIDMYWQYTGTELTDPGYLGLQTGGFPTGLHEAFTFVEQQDEARDICWT